MITFLILAFVIFSEIATSSERTEMLTKHRSQNSQAYQIAVRGAEQQPVIAPALPVSHINTQTLAEAKAELADAEYELSRCDRHASKGQKRVESCQVYEEKRIAKAQGTINAVSAQNDMIMSAATASQERMLQSAKSHQLAMLEQVKSLQND